MAARKAILRAVGVCAGLAYAAVAFAQSVTIQPPVGGPEPPRTSLQPPLPALLPNDAPIPPTLPAKPQQDVILPNGARVTMPSAKRQTIRFGPRYGKGGNFGSTQLDKDGDVQQFVFTEGLIVNVALETDPQPGKPAGVQEMEFATDNAVVWVTGAGGINPLNRDVSLDGAGGKTRIELYLSGNVIIRTRQDNPDVTGPGRTVYPTLRAEQIYYDVNNNRAVALSADLELAFAGLKDSVRIKGAEVQRLGLNEWRAIRAEATASKLPSDPALRFAAEDITYTRRQVIRRNIFGFTYTDRKTGEEEIGYEQILTGRNVTLEYMDVPFLYLPYLRTDATDPLGPLTGVGFGNDRIFGFQAYTTWDVFKLLAIRPPTGHNWRFHLDYLSDRGPGFGTDYQYQNNYDFFEGTTPPPPDHPYYNGRFSLTGPNRGEFKLYGIPDNGTDVLGGFRGPDGRQADFRGRGLWYHEQELYEKGDWFLRYQKQNAYLSDKNYFEQYFKQEFDTGRNQENYSYVYGAAGNLGGSLLLQTNLGRNWVTETEWLPRLDAYLIGQSLLKDWLNYTARGSVGYAQLKPTGVPPFAVLSTEQPVNTGRIDFNQDLSLPLDLGPVKVTPYGVLDLTGYSNDLTGESRGRLYGGAGGRLNLPISRLYQDANSEIFNLRGLYHKAAFGLNYFYARSDTRYTDLPLLDRLNDDAIDQSYRNMRPYQPLYTGGAAGTALATSPVFDPQLYAIRRLIDNRVDTLDQVQVAQVDLRQRLQTKRGFPGAEHVVDWMALDLSASFFPDKDRDNFGHTTSFLEYSGLWNVGDRTALSAAGWIEPYDGGSRYNTVGASLGRPDGTNFYTGYRQIDPLNSKAVTAALSYQLSRRYLVGLTSTYDFGTNTALSNTVNFVRVGTDLTVSLGFTYNAIVNNFGAQLIIVPNLAALFGVNRLGGVPMIGMR